MKSGIKHKISTLAIFAPCLMLLVLISASVLKGDTFYRIAKLDPQWFYWQYSNDGNDTTRTFWYNGESSSGPNTNITDHDFYYDTLAAIGFNMSQGCVLNGPNASYLYNDSMFHGIKVFNQNTHNVQTYMRSQFKPCRIGAHEKIQDLWKKGRKGEARIEEFTTALEKWKSLHFKAIKLFKDENT